MPLSTKVDITKIGKLKKSGQGKNPIYLQKIRCYELIVLLIDIFKRGQKSSP